MRNAADYFTRIQMEQEDPMSSSSESDLPSDSDSESLDDLHFDSTEEFFTETSEKQRSTCDDLSANEGFALSFGNHYPSPGPNFFTKPLDEALHHSLFKPQNPCPLAIYVHHKKSIAVNIFCTLVLSSQPIINYLNDQFIVWPWDRTYDNNFHRLLTMLDNHVGSQITQRLASISMNSYPLLMCLSFEKGQIQIINVIEGTMSLDETYNHLLDARKAYDRREELPDILDDNFLFPNDRSNKNACISNGLLIPVAEHSDISRQIANDLTIGIERIVRIHQIHNVTWLCQYLSRKETIAARLGNDLTERRLFHACSREAAESIVERGFDHRLIGMNGTSFGHGFYFSSSQLISHGFATPDRSNNNECSLLICRVIVGQSCIGNSTMRTCPIGYDSTTDGSNVYVVYSNQQILPEFLVTYK